MQQDEFDFELILGVLVKQQVDFIVVGGLCAVLHGAPIHTQDLDIVPSRDPANLARLESALHELAAYYREHPPGHILPEAARMTGPGHHLLRTTAGMIDVLGAIAGKRDYIALLPHTIVLELDDKTSIRILDLPTLIATKQETNRTKDRLVLPILRHTLEEQERSK